jgi:hypothetical protein
MFAVLRRQYVEGANAIRSRVWLREEEGPKIHEDKPVRTHKGESGVQRGAMTKLGGSIAASQGFEGSRMMAYSVLR